jgi:Tol biopolymer transport system component
LLLIGRDAPWEEEAILFTYHVDTGQRVNLFSHKQIRGGDLSPNGTWVAYFLTFAEEPADNGLWLINIAAGTRRKIEVPDFGGYRWRSDDSLLFIPFRASAEVSMQLWAIDAPTGQVTPLTTPATLSFSISNGDWDVSPDGQHIVFVNSVDQNIWLITLP